MVDFIATNISPEKISPDKSKTLSSSVTLEDKDDTGKDDTDIDDTDIDDNSSTLPQLSLPKSKLASKIIRAQFFVKNKMVSHNLKLKIYHVVDEKGTIFNVNLLPKPNCSCPEKSKCCHILAVEYTNGKPLSECYKIPNLSKLTRKKNNNKISGKKRTGQVSNSVEVSAVTGKASAGSRVTRSKSKMN